MPKSDIIIFRIANMRLTAFLTQNPPEAVKFILRYINSKKIQDPATVVKYLREVSNRLPIDLITPENLRLIRKDIRQHIEHLEEIERSNTEILGDENDELPYFEDHVDPDEMNDTDELHGYDD